MDLHLKRAIEYKNKRKNNNHKKPKKIKQMIIMNQILENMLKNPLESQMMKMVFNKILEQHLIVMKMRN